MYYNLTLLPLLFLATICDIRHRLIPNQLIFIGSFIALVLIAQEGITHLTQSLMTVLIVWLIGFTLFERAWCGAGDIKLLMMVSLFFSRTDFFLVVLYSLIMGGVISLWYQYQRPRRGVPYALPITLGVILMMLNNA